MSAVEIIPATIRDLTFIAANIRAEDWREAECQLPDEATPVDLALVSLAAGEAWVATWRNQPVAAVGYAPETLAGNVLILWAWGTRSMWRAVPAITRHVRTLAERWVAAGVTRVEARSIAGHDAAHRWLRSVGAKEQPCPNWGKGGEDFVLFAWTLRDWQNDHA